MLQPPSLSGVGPSCGCEPAVLKREEQPAVEMARRKGIWVGKWKAVVDEGSDEAAAAAAATVADRWTAWAAAGGGDADGGGGDSGAE